MPTVRQSMLWVPQASFFCVSRRPLLRPALWAHPATIHNENKQAQIQTKKQSLSCLWDRQHKDFPVNRDRRGLFCAAATEWSRSDPNVRSRPSRNRRVGPHRRFRTISRRRTHADPHLLSWRVVGCVIGVSSRGRRRLRTELSWTER